MTPETKLKVAVLAMLSRRKKAGEPIWFFKVHGGPVQMAGLPDIHITYRGRSIWVELKAPGGAMTRLQEHRLGEIRRAGGTAECCRSVDEVVRLLLAAGRYEDAVQKLKQGMEQA